VKSILINGLQNEFEQWHLTLRACNVQYVCTDKTNIEDNNPGK
jgi:hypothetical protein